MFTVLGLRDIIQQCCHNANNNVSGMTCEDMLGQCCPNVNGNAGLRARGLVQKAYLQKQRSSEA